MEENNDSYHEQNKEPNDADSENQDSYHQSNTEDESNDENKSEDSVFEKKSSKSYNKDSNQ